MGKGKKKKSEEQGKEDVGKKEDEKSQEKEKLLQKAKELNEDTKAKAVEKDEGKTEEQKDEKRENDGGEVKEQGEKPAAPPAKLPLPPEEVVLKVLMHCEGCAKKVRGSLKGLDGVEDVKTDCKTNTVVVKGKKAAQDPRKVAETIYRKSRKRAEVLSPAVPAPLLPKDAVIIDTLEKMKEKKTNKKNAPQGMVVAVLKVYMHCEACAEEIKRRILKLDGVQVVEPNLGTSQVTVKGNFDPDILVKYIYKRTGKHAVIIKQEQIPAAEKKKETADAKLVNNSKPENEENEIKEEKADEEKPKEENKDKDESSSSIATVVTVLEPSEGGKGKEDNLNCYYFPSYPMEYAYPNPYPYQYHYPPPPQIFSDENPNACVVM